MPGWHIEGGSSSNWGDLGFMEPRVGSAEWHGAVVGDGSMHDPLTAWDVPWTLTVPRHTSGFVLQAPVSPC